MKQITNNHHVSDFESVWYLEADEAFDIDAVIKAYDKAVATPRVFNFFVILPPTADRTVLRKNGFEIAGNLQRGTTTLLKWRKAIGRSNERSPR